MRVMKFGGTSLATPSQIRRVVSLVRDAAAQEPVVVVTSALAGVTDDLTDLVDNNRRPPPEFLLGLAQRHLGLWREAVPGRSAGKEFDTDLWVILRNLQSLGEESDRSGGWSASSRDRALGVGDRASAVLLSAILEAEGVPAQPVPGSDVIRTDSTFGSARVNKTGTRHLARWTLGRLPPGVVPVVAGFTGSDEGGRPTTLGRGSSDLTATLIAAALSAREVEIWTDVDGIHERDPKLDPQAPVLPHLGYHEARTLACNGAKVLHPSTLDPIEPLGIPLRVRNTFRPETPGTLVSSPSFPGIDHRQERKVHLILAGATGGVGRTFLNQLQNLSPSLRKEGIKVLVSGAFSSRAQIWNPDGLRADEICSALVRGSPPDWEKITQRLVTHPPTNPVFVDCTASSKVSDRYLQLLAAGIPVVTPNKLAGSGTLAQYRSIKETVRRIGLPYRYETTVGAALPILRTIQELREGGDRFRSISGVLSGTLSFVFAGLAEGLPFSRVVREARDRGFTEPHPREDLSGADVARKLLILLREAGVELEPEAIPVESLVPDLLSEVEDPEEFLDGLSAFDHQWVQRIHKANGKPLAYVAWFDGERSRVGVRTLSPDHPLSTLRPTENMVVLKTDRYPDVPLTIAGPGAGREVTASGVLVDFLAAIRERYGIRRVA